jgi:hypothetical protein
MTPPSFAPRVAHRVAGCERHVNTARPGRVVSQSARATLWQGSACPVPPSHGSLDGHARANALLEASRNRPLKHPRKPGPTPGVAPIM